MLSLTISHSVSGITPNTISWLLSLSTRAILNLGRQWGHRRHVQDKIKTLRVSKNWTQEDMAEKLNLSVNGYANIERGDTDLTLQRLERIANVFDMNHLDLLNMGEKNIGIFFNGNNNSNNHNIHQSDTALANENDKLKLEIGYLKKDLAPKDREIHHLGEINGLLRAGR